MFPLLGENYGVAAMTASNATESSWADYCPPNDDVVNGVHIGSCLGDLFSTNWMEDTESHNPANESLLEQYQTVKELTFASPVELFGELDFGNEFVGDFQGVDEGAKPSISRTIEDFLNKIPNIGKNASKYAEKLTNSYKIAKKPTKSSIVDSRDV